MTVTDSLLLRRDDKVCARCKETKPRTEFHRGVQGKGDGLQSRCKACVLAYNAEYRARPEIAARLKVKHLEKSTRLGLVCWLEKPCRLCGEVKALASFPRNKGRFDGRDSRCTACKGKAFRSRHRERLAAEARIARARRYATATGRAAAIAATARWKGANPEALAAQRERANERRRGGRPKPEPGPDRDVRLRAQHVKRMARWRKQAGRSKMTPAELHHWKMGNDPAYVINMRMRNAIKKALRGGKAGRKWESLVGYTLEDLVRHLERQMPRGYALADIGGGRLHIDHIVPKVEFDVTTPEGLRAAWCLSNLRPVLAEVNLRKGARRETLL